MKGLASGEVEKWSVSAFQSSQRAFFQDQMATQLVEEGHHPYEFAFCVVVLRMFCVFSVRNQRDCGYNNSDPPR